MSSSPSTQLLPREQAGFQHERLTVDQVTLLTQDIKESYLVKKRASAVFIDLTAGYDTIGTASSLLPERHMVKRSWSLLQTTASPLPPEAKHKAGYDASKTAFHKDRFWHPFYITSTPTTCLHQSHRNMLMQTILLLCILLETGRPSKGLLVKTL